MPVRSNPRGTARWFYPHAVAFSVQLARNLIVQGAGMTMVVLMGLTCAPPAYVAAWTAVMVAVICAEHQILKLIARGERFANAASALAPIVRVLATSLYALAALVLIARGDGSARLFAFALMTTSMLHVLMRYYRSPRTLMASLMPYVFVLGIVVWGLAQAEIAKGHWLSGLAASFTLAIMGVQFWSARAQLAAAWLDLLAAREEAERRERCAEAANLAKSQFLATMSHELRTPLNGVLGMAQALTTDQLTQTQHERVKIIRRSSESLLAVLNDLLDLSKIESSALELELGEFDLEHLVRGVVAAYRPPAEKKGVAFDFEISPAARGLFRGDSARIRRILYCLCENAVKFTEAGGIALAVDRQDGRTVFRIADTGIGIAQEHLAHLFEGFFQADGTLKRRYGGAGLGLAICHDLTTLMGGTIEARSRLGEGSTFVLSLPIEPAVAKPAAAPAPAEAERPAELRVLAAEDNATNQLVLKTLLAQAGVTPTLAVNGREALAAWEAQVWDIILMDIQMPEMDGIEATRAIRQREAETGRARTPIVAVTANAMTHQVAEYLAAGMDGMVPKPIDVSTLFNAIETALEQAEAEAVTPCQDIFAA